MRLYDFADSGNGYKARLLLHLLDRPYELTWVDILKGESRTPEFLAKNPNGRIPLLELEDGRRLAESNAILYWLAQDTPYLPADAWARAEVMQWLFFEQYSHEPYIATLRFWMRHTDMSGEPASRAEEKRRGGRAALAVMEGHLGRRAWFVGDHVTIADIALYAYTHVADQAGFELGQFPAVSAWLGRMRALPRYIPMLA